MDIDAITYVIQNLNSRNDSVHSIPYFIKSFALSRNLFVPITKNKEVPSLLNCRTATVESDFLLIEFHSDRSF